ncbi:hypothetical protein ACPCG0_08855 [Propionibacteriaceae bacterium Y1923]|uniref:hypothetical protein n=1 Tax=Aestuariimicrobium sp. Y1814 TaxID=3418742 RepID=UPI003C16D65C
MDNSTIAIIVTVVLSLAALGWTMLGVQRMRGTRHLLQGIGLVLLPVGLWLLGVMELLVDGAQAIYRFFADGTLDSMAIAGLVVGGLGVLVFLSSAAVKPVTRADSKERRVARKQAKQQLLQAQAAQEQRAVGAGSPSRPAAQEPARTRPQQPTGTAKGGGLSSEDAEIEALLKKRGIE